MRLARLLSGIINCMTSIYVSFLTLGAGNNCITNTRFGSITSLHCVFALKVQAYSETLMDMR